MCSENSTKDSACETKSIHRQLATNSLSTTINKSLKEQKKNFRKIPPRGVREFFLPTF